MMSHSLRSFSLFITTVLVVTAGFFLSTKRSFAAGICGNGKRTVGEACDDKNKKNGDGCSKTCKLESGWTCTKALNKLSKCTKMAASSSSSPLSSTCTGASNESCVICSPGGWDGYHPCSCPTGKYWNGNECVCPNGQVWKDFACTTCPSGQMIVDDHCGCPRGTTWNGTECKCPAASQFLGEDRLCHCVVGQYYTGVYCKACPYGLSEDGATCSCPAGMTWNGFGCSCSYGTHGSGSKCTSCSDLRYGLWEYCYCPTGQAWDGSACAAPESGG